MPGTTLADTPQRVLGQHLQACAFDLAVGQLELHALERRQRLTELLPQSDMSDGEFQCPVQHSEQRPTRQHQREGNVSTPSASRGDSSSRLTKARPPADLPAIRDRCPSRVTATQRPSMPSSAAEGRSETTTTSPSASRSAGRASRSATGYGSAQ